MAYEVNANKTKQELQIFAATHILRTGKNVQTENYYMFRKDGIHQNSSHHTTQHHCAHAFWQAPWQLSEQVPVQQNKVTICPIPFQKTRQHNKSCMISNLLFLITNLLLHLKQANLFFLHLDLLLMLLILPAQIVPQYQIFKASETW